jgi:TatD DNase family protein
MRLCDTHCHLNLDAYDGDRDLVIARAEEAGVGRFLVIGFDLESSLRAVELAARPNLRAAIGIHPESGLEWMPEIRDRLTSLFRSHADCIAAYGEIGLDYHWETLPRDRQQAIFQEQIAFAAELSPALTLIIHCRDAFEDVLAVLRGSGTPNPIVMHCFTGDRKDAEACLEIGCFLGIGGVVTYKKSEAVRDAVAAAPLDRLILETDCPYLAPQPWRGKRNEPAYVTAVADVVASVRGISVEDLAAATSATAGRLFRW